MGGPGAGAPPGGGGYGAPPPGAGYGAPPPGGGYGQPAPAQGQDFAQQMNQGFNQAAAALDQGINQALGWGGQPQQGGAMGYPQQGGMQQAGAPGGGAIVGQHGPKGMVRNPMMILVYGLISCGIYQMIWFIQVCNEMKAFLGREDPNWLKIMGLSMVTCGFYGLYWMITSCGALVQEVQQRAGVPNPVNQGVMYLVPYYNVILLQQELNKAWQGPA